MVRWDPAHVVHRVCVCMLSFRSVGPRICLAKVQFLGVGGGGGGGGFYGTDINGDAVQITSFLFKYFYCIIIWGGGGGGLKNLHLPLLDLLDLMSSSEYTGNIILRERKKAATITPATTNGK